MPPTPSPNASPFPATTTDPIRVGGLERFSLVDWPGRIAATVFLQGCGWRCPYCHNPGLLNFTPSPAAPSWSAVLDFLGRRRGLLDAVVFSGGEPTLQTGLPDAIRAVRELGFRIGLHTGGPLPDRIPRLLPLVDWVGFDYKAPFENYAAVTGRPAGDAAATSLRLLLASGVAYEIRTTWHPALLPHDAIARMANTLADLGVRRWTLQRFRAQGCAEPALCAAPAGFAEPLNSLTERLNGMEELTVTVR